MEREELDELVECYDCGATLEPAGDGVFVIEGTLALCWACAERRGGVYDAREERWTRVPDLSDVPDERRPHP